MKTRNQTPGSNEQKQLCTLVRKLVSKEKYEECIAEICKAMGSHPHAPEPHNLLGIVLEKTGDHASAMRHFRAAWALDPSYLPANHNLNTYGTFFSSGKCAFDESDLPPLPLPNAELVYDERGIGRMVSNTTIEYDEHGIGHVVRR